MKTGWPPGLLQDDDRGLSKWFASKPDARRLVRERCKEIEREHMNQHTLARWEAAAEIGKAMP